MFSGSLDALTVIRDFHERKISLWLLDLGGYVSGNDVIEPMLKILSSILECERGHRSERIREAKEQQRRKGKFLGGAPPFGWTRNPAAPDELLLVDAEQTAITEMREMRGTGCSLRDIAEEMRARGFQLSHEGVKRILKRDETALEAARGGQEPEVAARGDILTPAPRTSNRLAHPSYFRE
jgi:DNA invertase Pin-like site-specific DNA recombinase